jgi:hypothetical protein
MTKENKCKFDGDEFYCSVDWNASHNWNTDGGCMFHGHDNHSIDNCDFYHRKTLEITVGYHFVQLCLCRLANMDAARVAANESIEKCRESTDEVLNILNKLYYLNHPK